MKVAIVLLAVVAVALADTYKPSYSSGYKQDYSHVPYYKFDWAVKDDYYNDYGQYEAREGYNTKGNWWVKLPGQSHINDDYTVNAQTYGYQQTYQQPEYKQEYKPVYKQEYKPVYKTEYKPVYKTEYKPDYKPEYKADTYKAEY